MFVNIPWWLIVALLPLYVAAGVLWLAVKLVALLILAGIAGWQAWRKHHVREEAREEASHARA